MLYGVAGISVALYAIIFMPASVVGPSAIQVFAGQDRTMCFNQNLVLNDLGANISGDVSDGDWITFGDGRFQPGNLSTVKFKFAQTNNITYIPGTNDKALGFYRFMLISDAPTGGTPQQRVSDEVIISFQSAPPIFCASNLNIALNESCTQKVDVTMLQANPVAPFTNYIITLYDQSNQIIPDNILTKAHIGREITYKLGHQCTANICWGKFKVDDYFPPVFVCQNDTIQCTSSILPDSIGFPFPKSAFIDTIINDKYIVKNWDACSDVVLEFTDITIKANCVRDEDKTITRKWKATDSRGNVSYCNENIVVKRISLAQVVFPPHYDGQEKPFFECGDNFPRLLNGHPSPDTTGRPLIGHCGNLQFNMTDVRFDLCGKSFKIARSWFLIDWCTSESVTKNQIIVVKDTKGPDIQCRDTISLFAGAYLCGTDKTQLPALVYAADCSDIVVSLQLFTISGQTANSFLTIEQGKYFIHQLPVGNFLLQYIASDACNNVSTCQSIVKVTDQTAPYPVCDQTTKTALDAQGRSRVFAQTFDDGSTDNCGIASFSVRRMNDACGFGTSFGPFVDFCCSDIGTVQMVALEVTDIYGNKNTCMVEVIVEDKIKPAISCPPNITLACTDNYDPAHLNIFGKVATSATDVKDIFVSNNYHSGWIGKDGLATDNCSVSVHESVTTNIQCHTGTITRKFTATDSFGSKDSCTQTIFIYNPDPFDGNDTLDIKWPKHYESNGCKSSQTDPEVTGKPVFFNTSCANVSATYEDQAFYIADGACVKIIRYWTVIDWCQFSGNHTHGKWGPYIQIIKLHNTDKPQFVSVCRDTSFCSFDTECKNGYVELSQTAVDSCTDMTDLKWIYQLDIGGDGIIDSVGNKSSFAGNLPLGIHKITWRVEDQCGNFNTCVQTFTISDCKKPTPYCISSITIPLMQPSGTAAIWAKDFDLGSFDNCTEKNNLIFTFNGAVPVKDKLLQEHYFTGQGQLSTESAFNAGIAQKWIPATKSSGIIFNCSDIPDGISAIVSIQMTVTDALGNQDFCSVELVLQDNADLCPDQISEGVVSGNIVTPNGKIPENTIVKFKTVENEREVAINNTNGQYNVALPLGKDYTISPSLNINPLEGVSTLDLVMIQRHILGLGVFDSPYKVIAADINSSGSVTASDLVELRKLILGITDKFPKGLPSWVFVAKNGGITDVANPFGYLNYIETGILRRDTSLMDFIAVKIGDVNLSAFNLQDNEAEFRSDPSKNIDLIADVEEIDDNTYLTFRMADEVMLDGLQVFTKYTGETPVAVSDVYNLGQDRSSSSFILNKQIRFLRYSEQPQLFSKGEIIQSFELDRMISPSAFTLEAERKSEAYLNGEVYNIRLKYNNAEKPKPLFSLITNPVSSVLRIKTNHSFLYLREYSYHIMDTEGKVCFSSSINLSPDQQEYTLSLPAEMIPGIYTIHFSHPSHHQALRFILIK